jgi:hypothetical protein
MGMLVGKKVGDASVFLGEKVADALVAGSIGTCTKEGS